jgi:hypothetical protein
LIFLKRNDFAVKRNDAFFISLIFKRNHGFKKIKKRERERRDPLYTLSLKKIWWPFYIKIKPLFFFSLSFKLKKKRKFDFEKKGEPTLEEIFPLAEYRNSDFLRVFF